MLPFLKPKHISSVIIATHSPEKGIQDEHEEGEEMPGLISASEDLIKAIHAKDAKAVASALKAADDIMDAEQEEEENGDE